MNALSISLLAVLLLPLVGCGDRVSVNKTEAAAPSVTAKELPPEIDYASFLPKEEFAETKKKADAGNAIAQLNLGGMYAFGNGVSKDAAKAVEWWQKAAAQGDDAAQYNLGLMYAGGAGVPKDASKAVEWWQKAAAQGSANAQYALGEVHFIGGENSLFNLAKAAEWFQKAAVQGHVDAQKNLGWMYANGLSVPEDAVKAFDWYLKAAMQGDASAQFKIGVRYAKGDGVSKDAAKAVEWYQKASAQGDAKAQYNLGVMYAFGNGVPKDAAKAVEWFQKAAAQGDADAQYNLGVMYAKGDGVSKDMVRAYAWANLAAAQGHKNEKKMRDLLEKLLTATQRTEGQRLASNWKKGDTLLASGGSSPITATPNDKPSKKGTGTAFAVSNAGHALTNHHVINGCTEVKVAGREGIAKVITSDSVNDLALLQLPGKSQDIASLNPDPGKLRQGEDIIVFGYPLEWALSSGGNLTPGTISALTGLGNNTNQIQITAPIQPGSSGSPVMDKKGNVVGVVSMKLSDSKMAKATGQIGQNVNFAVNGQTVKAFLDANKVPYKTGGGLFSREKSNADIAEEASKWTVLVECWK